MTISLYWAKFRGTSKFSFSSLNCHFRVKIQIVITRANSWISTNIYDLVLFELIFVIKTVIRCEHRYFQLQMVWSWLAQSSWTFSEQFELFGTKHIGMWNIYKDEQLKFSLWIRLKFCHPKSLGPLLAKASMLQSRFKYRSCNFL